MGHKKVEYSLVKVLLGTVVGTTAIIYLGLLTGFFPFGCFGENITARVVSYCTVVLCAVMVLCTFAILKAIKEHSPKE